MNFTDFQNILHFSENRNKNIDELKQQKEIMEELEIPQYA